MQLELSFDKPFSLRLSIAEGFRLFRELYWESRPKGKNTRKCFVRIEAFFRSKGIAHVDEIGKVDVEALRDHLSGLGLKANTVNTHHIVLTRFYNWLYECKETGTVNGIDFRSVILPPKNPASLVPKVNEQTFARKVAWPKRVVLKLIAAAQRLNDQDLADIIDVLYLTQLRPGDVWRMTDANVDLAHGVISGIQHKSVTRRLPSGLPYVRAITPRLHRLLSRRAAAVKPGQPLFMPDGLGVDAWRNIVQKRFKAIRDYARLPHVQLRDFRPSAATLALDNGIDPMTVSEGLGHTSLRMLPVYARRTLVHQRKAQEKVEDETSEILF